MRLPTPLEPNQPTLPRPGTPERRCAGSELADLCCAPGTLDEPRGGELPTGGTWHVPALWCRPGTTYSWVFC